MPQEITGHTRLGCLLGTPVTHSLSPMMYNESFRLIDGSQPVSRTERM